MTVRPTTDALRETIAHWIMRAREGGRILQIPFWGLTAAATTLSALHDLGLQRFQVPAMVALGVGSLAFIWLYDRTKVLNRQQRATMDRSDNFAGPGMAMANELRAAQFQAHAEAIRGECDPDAIPGRTRELLQEFRDGIDLEAAYGNGSMDDGGDAVTVSDKL